MIEKISYICSYCEKEYDTPEECEECENKHEIPVEITEFDFNKISIKYPSFITVKTTNNRFARYQYLKPIVPSEDEEKGE